jgi:hypothetical protein
MMDDSNPLSGLSLVPEGAGPSAVESAWSAYCTALGVRYEQLRDAAAVRAAFEEVLQLPEYARGAATTLLQVAEAFGVEPAADALVPIVSDLFEHLPSELLDRLTRSLLPRERKRFAAAALPVISQTAALRLVHTLGSAFGAALSPPLSALLHKLASRANALAEEERRRADQSLRGLVLQIVDAWAAAATRDAPIEPRRWRVQPEPLRVVQLALEARLVGRVVESAVAEQAHDEAGARELLTLAAGAPAGSPAADRIIGRLATLEFLATLLQEEPLDLPAVDAVLSRVEAAAARVLLERLVDAKDRGTRRALMDRLVKMGPGIEPYVLEWIEDPRWYVVRNMISLLREAGCSIAGVPLEQFRTYTDPRVRRECLQLQLDNPVMRNKALLEALLDPDRHMLRLALQAARTELPESAVALLAERLAQPDFPAEFRVMAIYLLARSGSPHSLDALLRWVHGGTSFLGRPRLAPKSPEMLAALGGLARHWQTDRRAAALIEQARRSKDDQMLAALRAGPQPS